MLRYFIYKFHKRDGSVFKIYFTIFYFLKEKDEAVIIELKIFPHIGHLDH